MYGDPIPSRHVVGPWQDALSDFAGEPLTLLWADECVPDRSRRGGTISLVSRGSLERLREEAGVEAPVDGRRFRMLFEIDGVGAHEEDEWLDTEVRVGDAVLRLNGDVGRCVVTSHDPDSGVTRSRHARRARALPARGAERAAPVRRLRLGCGSRPRARGRRREPAIARRLC